MAADITTRTAVNSLLNYDVSDDDEDPFREIDTTIHDPDDKLGSGKRKATVFDNKENADTLGLDEEVKIVKKRKPVVKLDEARLISQPGIPKLRTLARSRSIASKLRLKGKSHEYSDAAKLLSFYQLWLDNLFPRAKFADGLQLVEKVGHSKSMHVMRRQWIDEGKPGYGNEMDDNHATDYVEMQDEEKRPDQGIEKDPCRELQKTTSNSREQDSIFGNIGEGDDDDLFFADPANAATGSRDDFNEPDEDELDAVLAEQDMSKNARREHKQHASTEHEDDDQDASMTQQKVARWQIENPKQREPSNSSPDEEDDLDAILAENEARQLPLAPAAEQQQERNEQPAEGEEDELEALLAEQEAGAW